MAATVPTVHPMAPANLPGFLPDAAGSDFLLNFCFVLVIVAVLALGVAYFTIHALPERLAHRMNSAQSTAISVLVLLALFTGVNLFWVIALLLAVVRFPDFLTPLTAIAGSLDKISRRERRASSRADAAVPVAGQQDGVQ